MHLLLWDLRGSWAERDPQGSWSPAPGSLQKQNHDCRACCWYWVMVIKALNKQISSQHLKRSKSHSAHLREHPGHPWWPRRWLQSVVVVVLSHSTGLGAFSTEHCLPQDCKIWCWLLKMTQDYGCNWGILRKFCRKMTWIDEWRLGLVLQLHWALSIYITPGLSKPSFN